MYVGHFIYFRNGNILENYKNMTQALINQPENIIYWSWHLIFKTEKRLFSSYFCAYTACADFKYIGILILKEDQVLSILSYLKMTEAMIEICLDFAVLENL